MLICGIDPGANGYAVSTDDNLEVVDYLPLPKLSTVNFNGNSDIKSFRSKSKKVRKLIRSSDLVVLEKVHSMPKQGVASVFSFGMSYGMILSMCSEYSKNLTLVAPATWQSGLKKIFPSDLKSKAFSKNLFTNEFKDVALDFNKVSKDFIDAFLMTVWYRTIVV